MSFISNFLGALSGNVRTKVGEPDRSAFNHSRNKGFGNQTNNAFGHMENNKFNFGRLVYPESLEQDVGYGHYMLFYAYKSPASTYADKNDVNFPKAAGVNIDSSKQASFNPNLFRDKSRIEESENLKQKLGYKKTEDAIALYMPPDVKFNYKSDYSNTATAFAGQFAETAIETSENLATASTIGDVLENVGVAATDLARNVLVERGIKSGGAYIADLLGAGDAAATANLARSKALNPHLEAIFEKVDFRTFNYTFRFTPKNENEVRTVHAIINTFKYHMLPEKSVDDRYGEFLIFPSEFEIHFMYKGSENTWLPFISHCVLNSVDVDYGGAQYQTFRPITKPSPQGMPSDGSDAPPPSTIVMTLSFTESEIMTKDMINKGF